MRWRPGCGDAGVAVGDGSKAAAGGARPVARGRHPDNRAHHLVGGSRRIARRHRPGHEQVDRSLLSSPVTGARGGALQFVPAGLLDLEELVGICGLVTRHESLQRQAESQVLLLLGWADPRETGQHSGKLFEYFGAARPILAIGGGRGVLTEALEETHAGTHALSKEQVRNFLVTAYSEFKANGYVAYQGKETAIDRYTHLRMARQFADLLNSVSHKSQPSEVVAGVLRE